MRCSDGSYEADDERARFSLDIAGAYSPKAGIIRWQRTIQLQRGQSVTIEDSYELNHTPRSLMLNLLTASQVDLGTAGLIRLMSADLIDGRVSGSGVIRYDAARLTPSVETISITRTPMSRVWGSSLYRIQLSAITPQQQDTYTLKISEA